MEVVKMDEEKIVAALKNGQHTAIYKNPTPEEINKISLNGVVKGILTAQNFIAFDFQNVNLRDLPVINGTPIIVYFTKDNEIVVELLPSVKMDQATFEDLVQSNQYLMKYEIKNIMVRHETE
jgi:hypothetical protein